MRKILFIFIIVTKFVSGQTYTNVLHNDSLFLKNITANDSVFIPAAWQVNNMVKDSSKFQTTVNIGNNQTPNAPLTVTNFNTIFSAPQSGTMAQFVYYGSGGRLVIDSYRETLNGSIIQGKAATGTPAVPGAAINDMVLMGINGDGYGTSSFTGSGIGSMTIRAEENFTNASKATNIQFTTTPTGSTTQLERMRIKSTGVVQVFGLNSLGIMQTDADGNIGNVSGGAPLQVLRKNAANTAFEWATVSAGSGDLLAANNLSDLANATTARNNLGLGTLATSSATIPTNTNELTNGSGYITGYTETDPIVRAINGIVKSNGTTISAAGNSDIIAALGYTPQLPISLTTVGSGAATLIGAVLNIPTPSGGSGPVPLALASNFSNSTTTQLPVTGWNFAVTSGKLYRIEIIADYQTAATTTGGTLGYYMLTGAGIIRGFAEADISQNAVATGLKAPIRVCTTLGATGSSLTSTGVAKYVKPSTNFCTVSN